MADNYLERKMEEHRKGGAPSFRRKLTPTGQRPGKVIIDFPPFNAFVSNVASECGAAVVKALCDAGCRVAFSHLDEKAGSALAQRCGAQFHPGNLTFAQSMERLRKSWGKVDITISFGGYEASESGARAIIISDQEPATAPQRANIIHIPHDGMDPKALATMVMLLSSPATAGINGQIFRL
ncbi:MAG: hypothetical protein NC102_03905 [Clostridium sp.]|nr:hypothetical protein [Clostridium sp.]